MAINPNGGMPGYYPPAPYPQQPGPYPPAGYGPPGMSPDLYAGHQAPPPGGGLQGGVASIGSSLNGIFGVIGSILNTVVGLVTSVVKGVFNLLGAIFKPILGIFGIGKNDQKQQQQQQRQQQAGNAMPQMPLYNSQVENALQSAEASIAKHESYVTRALAHRQGASVDEHVRMMNQALAEFQRHHEELSRVGRPDQVAAFNARAQEVLAMYQQLAGSPSVQATPGDLSGLQLPNDPAIQQNLAQFNQNYQLLSQAPGRAAQLTAEERQVVSQSINELRAQAAQFQQASPQVAAVLNEAVDRLDQQWRQAIAASPAATQSQNSQANGAGRQYRAVPLDLDLGGPAPVASQPAPTRRGA